MYKNFISWKSLVKVRECIPGNIRRTLKARISVTAGWIQLKFGMECVLPRGTFDSKNGTALSYGVPFVSKLYLLMGWFFSKNQLGSCCYLLKIDLVFVACLLKINLVFVICLQKSTRFLYATNIKNQLGFCNNHKKRFGFCRSLAWFLYLVKINSVLILITCIKTESVHWWINLVFVACKILTLSFVLYGNPFGF